MDKIIQIINRKPLIFIIASLGYILLIGLLKWGTSPPWGTLWFMAGAIVGIYFLDAAEAFFQLTPSPFRTIVFATGLVVVSLFVVTSSGSLLASGLVLSLHLTMILWQIGEWHLSGNVNSWYRMIAGPVDLNIQRWGIVLFVVLFLVETYLFIR